MTRSIFSLVSLTSLLLTLALLNCQDVGYRVGEVQGYKLLRSFRNSTLHEVQAHELDDGRPLKMLTLRGTHYQAGYAYGELIGKQLNSTYHTFFTAEISQKQLLWLVQKFLDWQYQQFVKKLIPVGFLDEIKGISDAGKHNNLYHLRSYIERVLVVSSFPGAIQNDIFSILYDEFLSSGLHITNEHLESMVQDGLHQFEEQILKFINKKIAMCSFFGAWGSRTVNGTLYTMRNLDWESNTGVNMNKLITVWKIKETIPHLTLGYPGVLGALTGMSGAGLTVHEAGMSSRHSTERGFQWTLRMREIMMKATNLEEAKLVWQATTNTLGMNFMVGSGRDQKAIAMETMRGYTAYFSDADPRENGTVFTDKNGKQYVGGYSMKDVVFRTNHAYDPIIREKARSPAISQNDDSMIRYRILSTLFNSSTPLQPSSLLKIAAILGDKGSQKFYSCKDNFRGGNVISVLYRPDELEMWVAFQYGFKETFRSACCGVYLHMSMKDILKPE